MATGTIHVTSSSWVLSPLSGEFLFSVYGQIGTHLYARKSTSMPNNEVYGHRMHDGDYLHSSMIPGDGQVYFRLNHDGDMRVEYDQV